MRRFLHHLRYLAAVFLVVACSGPEEPSAAGDAAIVAAKDKEQGKNEVVKSLKVTLQNQTHPL